MKAGIRSRLLASTLLPLALMGAVSLYTAGTAVSLASYLSALFGKNALIASLESDLGAALSRLSVYLSTKSSESLKEYIHHARALASSSLSLETRVMANDEARLERDARRAIESFLARAEEAIAHKRASRSAAYYEAWARSEAAAAGASHALGLLEGIITERRTGAIGGFTSGVIGVQRWNLAILGLMATLGLCIVLYFELKITDPLISLSAQAARIASGDFGGPDLPDGSSDEIGTLARGFNLMRESIEHHIAELRSKAEVEAKLMEQRLRNLEMANLLKHAELSSLQARIQPHFLFNTLNAGIQLATIEDADRTREFLENLSSMMRYSTRSLDAPATLAEEFSCAESYAFLTGIRFPGRFTFEFDLDPGTAGDLIPKLTIQPLVENCVQHGFPEPAAHGRIRLSARPVDGGVLIEVTDDGRGFPPGAAKAILEAARSGQGGPSGSAYGAEGHGLANVIRRLSLFSGHDDAVELGTATGGGALVRIILGRPR